MNDGERWVISKEITTEHTKLEKMTQKKKKMVEGQEH